MNILITGAWTEYQKYKNEIEKLGHRVAFMQWENEELPVDGAWVEGIICNRLLQFHDLAMFVNLSFIQLTSSGFDRIDLEEVNRRGIQIYNAKGVYSISMAEFVLAGVLDRYKRLDDFRSQQKQREWKKIRELKELYGKTTVIVGCGDVGTECAKRFKAFGCKVVGVTRTIKETPWFDTIERIEELDKTLADADIVVVAIALTPATRRLVKARLIKADALLVNVSRGETVNLEGAKCGLLLDVFDNEPLNKQSKLWERATVTPHNSFVSEGNERRLWNVIRENLENA